MLSRILASKPSSSKCSCFIKTLLSSQSQSQNQNPNSSFFSTINKGHRYFSSGNNDNKSSSWNISSLGGGDESIESLFSFNTIIQQQQSSKVSNNPNNDNDGVSRWRGKRIMKRNKNKRKKIDYWMKKPNL